MKCGPGVFGATVVTIVMAGVAVAENWELEIHGGALFGVSTSGGRATRPPSGERFETVVPGVSSVRVSSWFYGDGGRLIGERREYVNRFGTSIFAIQPLDPVLSRAATDWATQGGLGMRIARRLGRHLTAELGIDYAGHAPVFTAGSRSGIEDAGGAFDTAWNRTLSSVAQPQVASEVAVLDGSGHQLLATGVIHVNLRANDPPKWSRQPAQRRFVTYLTLGAGIVSSGGDEASATLVGHYRFSSPPGEPEASYEETDAVTVRSAETFGTSIVGVVGLGWKKDLSTRWGARVDVRGYVARNPTRIVLDARPSVAAGSPVSATVVDSTIGAIQFVNSGSNPAEGARSSLSGPALDGFETFGGTGLSWQINLTLGAYLRF